MSEYKSRMEREMQLEEKRHLHSDMINAVFDKVKLENQKERERHDDTKKAKNHPAKAANSPVTDKSNPSGAA